MQQPIETQVTLEAGDLPERRLDNSEITFLAHVYRAEIYRSTVWRTRMDTTTNWSVVTLGAALSISYHSALASAVPLLLVGVLISFFLMLEARRYRFFSVWRARVRWIERNFIAGMLGQGYQNLGTGWQRRLSEDFSRPTYHISLWTAMGRRLRRNYVWILMIQALAYGGKLMIHPMPATSLPMVVERARVGPLPGWAVMAMGAVYVGSAAVIALVSLRNDQRRARTQDWPLGMG